MKREDLIKHGEDPTDPGGYFIINGTERVIVNVEDLAGNMFMVESDGEGTYHGRFFASKGSYKIPHEFERKKDGLFYMSFTRVKSMPVVVVLKALGLVKDEDITVRERVASAVAKTGENIQVRRCCRFAL